MKSTKKSLLLSTLSLVLCFAMLLGTTFAWFTDEVQSGVNKIVAGNLDIEVSYKTANGAWESIEGKDSLFTNNLWEPGHTEYVTLKVENKGTLALTYKMMVTPVNEAGGINVKGDPFKLSDYLVFATTAASTTDPAYADRAAARTAAGNTMKLNQANLVKEVTMSAGDTKYVTLVIYMPETVGNEANYKTGTAAPTIDLGIKVVATQVAAEKDSFGTDYDGKAKTVAPYNVGPIYDYFPQVVKTESVEVENGAVKEEKTIVVKESAEDNAQMLASVKVPAGVQLNENVNELTLKVTPQEVNSEYTVEGKDLHSETTALNREVANFDVKVEGVASGNTTNLTVNVFIGKGLSNVKIYHNGALMSSAAYDPTTGMATFETPTFSDYTMAYDKAVAAIGTQTYGTLELAIAAAQSGETITMLKNVEEANGISVPSGKNFTVDFNGFTYSTEKPGAGSQGTKTQAFQLLKDSTIIFKNGTINCTITNKTVQDETNGKPIKMLIQNYCNLTLENMTLDGTNLNGTGRYTLSNNCGNVTINNSTIIAQEGGVAFDSYKDNSYVAPNVTVENSTIIGKIEVSDGATLVVKSGSFTDLANAIKYAADGATVKMAAASATSEPIELPTAMNKGITIKGNGEDTVLEVPTHSDLSGNINFENMTIVPGKYTGTDGAMSITGNVTFKDVTFTLDEDNKAPSRNAVVGGNAVVTFENVNFDLGGKSRGIMVWGGSPTIYVKNCTFDCTYPFNVDGGSPKFIVTDSTLNGWTSYGGTTTASFTNCKFGESTSGYAYARPYTNTTFTDCEFSSDFLVDFGAEGVVITLNNCTQNGAPVTNSIIESDPQAGGKFVINGVETTVTKE